ncbi:MAG: ribosome hibernation-promoting factor, HPF/YfiA family [Actinomycetota bacterium]
MMEITVRGRHTPLPDSLRRFATEKVGHLGKYLSTISGIDVEIAKDGARSGAGHVVDLTVSTSGPVFRASATSSDPHAALDLAVERVERRIKEFKRRRSGRPLHSRSRVAPADMAGEGGSDTPRASGLDATSDEDLGKEEASEPNKTD